jgi:hypothetical protein
MSIFSLANLAAESIHLGGGHPHFLKTNSTFSSIIGSTTSFIIGTGSTVNTFSSSITAITNLQEMLRLAFNYDPHNPYGNFITNFLLYNSSGGQTIYLFGSKKILNYRLSHNFTSDRYHHTAGFMSTKKYEAGYDAKVKDPKAHIHDVVWTPVGASENVWMMLLPMLFSLGLLAWDLVIVWHFKIAMTALGASKDLAGTTSQHPSHKGMLMITLLEVFEEANIQLMEVLEKFLCAKDTAVNGANKMKESVASLERKIGDVEQTANAAATATTVTQLNADLIRLNASVDMLKDDVTEIEDKLDFAIASIDAIIGVV